jgi:hypothetical protein
MDFLEKHIEITNKEKKRIERFAKDVLIEQHIKFKDFDKAFKELLSALWNEFGKKNLINKYSIHFGGVHNYFVNEVKGYRKDCPDKIKTVLENEVYEMYKSFNLKKYPNHEYDSDFEKIDYEIFVNELLKHDAYQNLSINIDHIKGDLEKKYISIEIENIEFFKLIHKNVISNSKPNKQISNINEETFENKQTNSNSENEILNKLNLFKDEEKYLILHSFYNLLKQYEKELKLEGKSETKVIDLAQFLRMIRICQGINDISMLENAYSKKQYKIVSEGLQYYEKLDNRKKLKTSTLNKIKDMQIPEIYHQIEIL